MSSLLLRVPYWFCNLWNKILTFFLSNAVRNNSRAPTVSEESIGLHIVLTNKLGSVSFESAQPSNGLVSNLQKDVEGVPANNGLTASPERQNDDDEEEEEVDLGEESDEDVSILHSHFDSI
jgi:hypothetical protein